MRHAVCIAVTVGLLAAGCGRSDEEAAPAVWCNTTGQILYLVDQHSTTLNYDQLRDWEDAAPEDVRGAAADMGAALRKYPVDADAPDLVDARAQVEEFARDRCQEGWEGPNPFSEG